MLAALLFLLLACAGVSIYLALGISSALLFAADGESLSGFVQVIVDRLNSQTLMAVPFFVIAATFMRRGGMARTLVELADASVGGLPGGLALVAIFAATLFAAISGSSLATAMAMGTLLIPEMLRQSYDRKFAVGVVGASGTLGILIPPSLALIVFGVVAEQSVPKLFLAGVVPGLLQAALFALLVVFRMRNHPLPPRTTRRAPLRRALPALGLPAFAMGGIYSGLVTVTEAAALLAALAIAAGLGSRSIRPGEVVPLLADAMRTCAGLILIVAFAMALGHWITISQIPARLVEASAGLELSAWQFLLLMNLVMLLLGAVLEVLSVILITVPIVLPLLPEFGIDPIHYAIIVVVNMELALLTPPIGLNLFVLSGISKAPLSEVIRGVAPFSIVLGALLLLVTFVPLLTLTLPKWVFG
ncbi:MAG: TRAP transporter large permease [Deltaproteobacteria bacterium]|nr:TRAP transporter large permease [Deltaproteobacteria bacterium]MDD9853817.1 TRAP transporter large permease [Deltaproteobacteria bacterium]